MAVVTEDKYCICVKIKAILGIGSVAIINIFHEVWKNLFPIGWTAKRRKGENGKEALKKLNDGGHQIISKIVTGVETCI